MRQYHVLYHPLACDRAGKEVAMRLSEILPDSELRFFDMTEIGSIPRFLSTTDLNIAILIVGGDGTLSHFANAVASVKIRHHIFYYAEGRHTDFWQDLGRQVGDPPVRINRYLSGLPSVSVGNISHRLLCGLAIGELLSEKPAKRKTADLTLTVDGTSYEYKKVRFVTVTKGKYCCGVLPSPDQDRFGADGTLTVTLIHGVRPFGLHKLLRFLRHGKKTENPHLSAFCGRQISLDFDTPTPFILDGGLRGLAKRFGIAGGAV